MATSKAKPRIGRPPRTDRPVKVMIVLPGAVFHRLKRQSRREPRPMGDIVTTALLALWRKS